MDRGKALDVATRIAHRMCAEAVCSAGECGWMVRVSSIHRSTGRDVVVSQPASCALYQGAAGIGLFLSEAFRVSGDPKFRFFAAGALKYAHRVLAASGYASTGFLSGAAGIAYALARHWQATGDEEFRDAAKVCAATAEARGLGPPEFDLLGGDAGRAIALLELSRMLDDDSLYTRALEIGDRLISTAQFGARGWWWRKSRLFARGLTGLSHGAAGVAHGLLELYLASGELAYQYAAEQALAYEREFFSARHGNWADLRHIGLGKLTAVSGTVDTETADVAAQPPFAAAYQVLWCHGAPGIALSRMKAHAVLRRAQYAMDAATALATTTRHLRSWSATTDFSLCHGIAGSCEALLVAASTLSDCSAKSLLEEIAFGAAERNEVGNAGWTSGTLDGGRDPSLMLGESGIGYFYLRLADSSVPSILLPSTSRQTAPSATHRHAPALEMANSLRQRYIRAHFGQTLSVLERLDARSGRRVLEAPTLASPEDELRAVYEALVEVVDHEADPERRSWLTDCFLPERTQFELHASIPPICDEVIARAARANEAHMLWDLATFKLAPNARVVETNWDWERWLEIGSDELPPATGCVYLCHAQDGLVHRTRLRSMAALLLRMIDEKTDVRSIAARIASNASTIPAEVLAEAVRDQLEVAYQFGLLEMVSVSLPQQERR